MRQDKRTKCHPVLTSEKDSLLEVLFRLSCRTSGGWGDGFSSAEYLCSSRSYASSSMSCLFESPTVVSAVVSSVVVVIVVVFVTDGEKIETCSMQRTHPESLHKGAIHKLRQQRGEGGWPDSDQKKGGCVDLVLTRGSKIPKV